MEFLLYRKAAGRCPDQTCVWEQIPAGYEVRTLRPRPVQLALPSERLGLKECLARAYFWLLTFGRYTIFYLTADDQIAHTAFVIPRCPKFPFLKKGDHEIGPCATAPEHRRRGCYHFMLTHITSLPEYRDSDFYMIVTAENEASVKGIEKAGFVRVGTVKKDRMKNYVTER